MRSSRSHSELGRPVFLYGDAVVQRIARWTSDLKVGVSRPGAAAVVLFP